MRKLFNLLLIILLAQFFTNCGVFKSIFKKGPESGKGEIIKSSDVDVPKAGKKEKDWNSLTKDEQKKRNKAVEMANKGNKQLKEEKYKDAIASFNGAIAEWPDLADAYFGLGNAYYKNNEYDKSISSFDTYINFNANNPDVYYTKGLSYKKLNDNNNAVKNFLVVTKLNPKDAAAYIEAATIYYEQEAFEDSSDNYEKAQNIDKTLIQSYLGMGNIQIKLNNYEKAIMILDEGLKIKQDEKLLASRKLARGLLSLKGGREKFNDEKYNEAEALLSETVNLVPDNYEANYLLGQTLFKLKKNAEAEKYLLKAYGIKKDDLNLFLVLAEIKKSDKKYKEAITYLEEAREKWPDNFKIYNYLGIIYSETESYIKAIENFLSAVKLKPDYAEAYFNLGVSYYQTEKYKEAEAAFNNAYENDSGIKNAEEFQKQSQAMMLVNEGNKLFEAKKYNDAIIKYNASFELVPSFVETLVNLANTYLEIKNNDRAVDYYKRALNIEKNYMPALIGLERAYRNKGDTVNAKSISKQLEQLKGKDPMLYYKLGLSFEANKKFNDAIEEYNTALIIDPQNKMIKKRIATVYYKKGILLFNEKNYNDAIGEFNKALKYNPAFFDAQDKINYISALEYVDRATKAFNTGDYDGAIAGYKEALRIYKDLQEIYLNLANCYIIKGMMDEAEKVLKTGIKNYPRFSDYYQMLGLIYKNKKEFSTAYNYYNKALSLDPQNDAILNDIGEIFIRNENYTEAEESFNSAIKINPKNLDAHINLGITYYKKGDYEKAVNEFEETKKLAKDYDPAYFNAGLAYYKLNQFKKSEENFKRAAALKNDVPTFYFYLARTQFYMEGKALEAIMNIEKTIEMRGDAGDYYGAGKIYEKRMEIASSIDVQKFLNKAIDSYKTVIKMAPRTSLSELAEERIIALIPDVRLMRTFDLVSTLSGNTDFDKGIIYAGDNNGILYAIDTVSKSETYIKNKLQLGVPITSDIKFYKNKVFAGMVNGRFICVNSGSFDIQWVFNGDGSVIGAAAFDGNKVYFGSEDGYIYALDIDSGRMLWKYSMGSPVSGDIIIDRNNIYLANHDGEVYSFSPAGNVNWKRAVIGNIANSIGISQGKIGVGTISGLFYLINQADGAVIKKVNLESSIFSGVTGNNGNFYCGAGNNFYMFDNAGNKLWNVHVDSVIKSTPDINNNLAVFSTDEGVVYALEIKDGKQKWKYIWNYSISSRALNISKNTAYVSDEKGFILDLYYK